MLTSPATALRVLLLLSLAFAASPLSAQTQSPSTAPAPPLRVEVATVRPHPANGSDGSDRRVLPGGRFVATGTTVRAFIRIAFGLDDNRITGLPGWADNELFDITATTADHVEITTPQQYQQFLLALLEDRFQLKFHREHVEGPVYWLEVDKPGKLGPGLAPSTPASQANMSTSSNGARAFMRASKMSMADVAAAMRRQAGRPVEDHTGLQGNFDFSIQWAPEQTADSTDPSLFTVLKEQLGLKLQPAKGSIETLAVDHIAHPTEN